MKDDGFITVLKLVFFMVYYPLKGLFYLSRWLFESAQDAKGAEQTRQFAARNATWDQQREIERRKRNTLYRGLDEPVFTISEQPKEPQRSAPLTHTEIVRGVRDLIKHRRRRLGTHTLERGLWSLIVVVLLLPYIPLVFHYANAHLVFSQSYYLNSIARTSGAVCVLPPGQGMICYPPSMVLVR